MFKLTKGINEVSWVNPPVPASSLSQPGPARANAFTNRIVNEWNALPVTVTDADSVNKFKNGYDAFRSKATTSKILAGEIDFNVHSNDKTYLVKLMQIQLNENVTEMNFLIQPWFHKRFLKPSLRSESKVAEDFVSNLNLNSILHWTTREPLKPTTPNQKCKSIKNVCHDISSLFLNSSLIQQSPFDKEYSFFDDNMTFNNISKRVPSSVIEMTESEDSHVQVFLKAQNKTNNEYSLLFADDLVTFFIYNKKGNIENKINKNINELDQWFIKWKMKISVEKSCSVVFSRYKKDSDNLNLKIYGNRIVSQKEIKFLGIKFDSKLNFNILVDEIKERCNNRLNIIKILSNKKWGLNQNTLGNLYKSLVGSILEYSFPCLNSFSENNIKKLQAIQNTTVRSILKLKYDTPSNIVHHEAFNKLKLITVSNRLFELSESRIERDMLGQD
ncbi:RNA-directed DNA polymerase from mobile element jockey-like [Brachionus plicatilis]|uniref:RNA-directed DNA polymerase from mobile element jockey-like n=1 Tax=Brachionus plicatilis TaxID=10195 RepID=A0A3M7QYV3_BRAPC|nr:RNA-directed DNA polymerase from mobile element jockey-like [Brachionus plicatilis]